MCVAMHNAYKRVDQSKSVLEMSVMRNKSLLLVLADDRGSLIDFLQKKKKKNCLI